MIKEKSAYPNYSQYGDFGEKTILEAVYIENRLYPNNLFISALPASLMKEASLNDFLKLDKNIRYCEVDSKEKKKTYLKSIQEFRYPLNFYMETREQIVSILLESYSHVSLGVSVPQKITVQDNSLNSVAGRLPEIGWTAPGFSLIGRSGSGKSVCIRAVTEDLPPVIIHTMDDGTRIPQITYLYAPCLSAGGLKALYSRLAEDLDRKLQNGQFYSKLVGKLRTIDQKTIFMAQLFRQFNVGMIILDEIQNLLNEKNVKVFDTLTYFFNSTYTGIVLIGTDEVCDALTGKEFLHRRLGETVWSDQYCLDFSFVSRIIDALFKWYMFPGTQKPAYEWDDYQEIRKFLFIFTRGVIYRITGLFTTLQSLLIDRNNSSETDVLDQLTIIDVRKAAMKHASRNQWRKIPEIKVLIDRLEKGLSIDEFFPSSTEQEESRKLFETKQSQNSVQSETDHLEDLKQQAVSKYSHDYSSHQIMKALNRVEARFNVSLSDISSLELWPLLEAVLKRYKKKSDSPKAAKVNKLSVQEMKDFIQSGKEV